MFFRRQRPKELTFQQRLENLRPYGFTMQARGARVRVTRGRYAVDLADGGGGPRIEGRAGLLRGEETAVLVDQGFQKFFRASSGKLTPALAEDLKGLHDFEEDLKEALGLVSLYNEALGTVSTLYLYDRVEGRDRGRRRIWQGG